MASKKKLKKKVSVKKRANRASKEYKQHHKSSKNHIIKYINVTLVDIEGILPFNKKDLKGFAGDFKEETRLRTEIGNFMGALQKNMHEPAKYIGEEKKYGKHLERFIFYAHGFLEIMVEQPLTINAHFTNMTMAKRYQKALKKTLRDTLPESKVKDFLIESVSIDDSEKQQLTYEKWDRMHHIFIHKSMVYTMVIIALVAILEATKALLTEISKVFFIVSSLMITIIAAVIISFFFEPIRKKIEEIVNKIMLK